MVHMFRKPGQNVEHRLPLPQNDEVIGTVLRSQGASKFAVACADEHERLCVIPGRLKRRFWVKENDLVLVKPWTVQSDIRGDIVWRYSIMDKDSLKSKGYKIP